MRLRSKSTKKLICNLGILLLLACTWIDAMPSMGQTHDELKDRLDYFLDKTGLWQGSWQLFAPNVDSINSIVTARLDLKDYRSLLWHSPNWRRMGVVEQFLRFRESEFYDSMRAEENKAVWDSFANYLAKQAEVQFGVPVKKIVLMERFAIIADPRHSPAIPYRTQLPYTGSKILLEKTF